MRSKYLAIAIWQLWTFLISIMFKVSGLRVEVFAGVLLVVVRNVAGFMTMGLGFCVLGFWVFLGSFVLGFWGVGLGFAAGMLSRRNFLISSIINVSGLKVEDTAGR